MGFDTTPIKTNKLVYKHKLHFENPNSLWFLLLKLYYMGRTAAQFAESSVPNGIQHIAKKCIAGRAILVDWYKWAQRNGRVVDAMTAHSVPFTELLEVIQDQGLSSDDFRAGDIILFRFGYISQYENMPEEKRARLDEVYKRQKPENIGIEPSEELLRFLWEKRIAAVAADSRSFEVWPCTEIEWHLHEWLLAGWGMPIGELFDLEELSIACDEANRYTFFLTSSPMNLGLHSGNPIQLSLAVRELRRVVFLFILVCGFWVRDL
ncbi:unnamed protein product [Aspergillus oryzae RIB40]|uniref:DNA, SC001 n=1 Tax=Aspergillus oryzae (strain ATCC 42149 / RIB 40) TaxID=510516 RepID=Q2UN14_ASPOR|nr:unnamed protein product [Aspergillus oryzae RIB40]BAE57051.1 unnamed protein product [Aspergillus oryzae RIB40]